MRNCEKCGRKKWIKPLSGDTTTIVDGQRVRLWKCANPLCPHTQAEESPFIPQHPLRKLYFDIEFGYSKFLAFDRKVPSKFLPIENMIEEGHVLCWASAWLDGADEFQYIESMCVTQEESLRNDDRRILEGLWERLDAAHYWTGHNSDAYDTKMVHYRFHKHGMGFPLAAKQVDSLKLAKQYMRSPSNGLDFFTNDGKQEMTREDWKKIALTGDPDTLLKMETYCRHDVRIGADWFRGLVHDIEMSGRSVWK